MSPAVSAVIAAVAAIINTIRWRHVRSTGEEPDSTVSTLRVRRTPLRPLYLDAASETGAGHMSPGSTANS